MSRRPPLHNKQRSRLNTSGSRLPRAFLTGKREEREMKTKLVALKLEKDNPNVPTGELEVDRKAKELQQQQTRDEANQISHRPRPRHGDNRWRRNLALARYPTPPERGNPFNNLYRHEVRRASCDFQLSESSSSSSDSSQEENATSGSGHNRASSTMLQPSPSLHPSFASSSTNCSPIYRRRTIPTITVTDTDRRRLSPLMLRNQDYMEHVQVLSHSMPLLFRSDSTKSEPSLPEPRDTKNVPHPASRLARSRPGSGRSSVVKLPPISPMPHPLTASCNSAKGNDITGINRTTLLM